MPVASAEENHSFGRERPDSAISHRPAPSEGRIRIPQLVIAPLLRKVASGFRNQLSTHSVRRALSLSGFHTARPAHPQGSTSPEDVTGRPISPDVMSDGCLASSAEESM